MITFIAILLFYAHMSRIQVQSVTPTTESGIASHSPHFPSTSWNGSNISNPEPYDIAKDVFAVKFFILLMYSLIAFVGLVGNGLVVWVVARTKSMQTITNIFIANLALSDILMCLVATPFTPVSLYMRSWTLPEEFCKLLPITMGVSVYVSTLTSMAIALDRFFVIVHPFLPRMRIWLCFLIIVAIWIIAVLISLPLAVYHQKHQHKDSLIWACQENWPKESSREVFTIVSFGLQFVVPCSIISVCYFRISLILRLRLRNKIGTGTKSRLQDENEIRRKKRTNGILIAMVVIFVICWIPLNMLLIVMDVLTEGQTKTVNRTKYFSLLFLVCHLLAMSSAVYNPFLYAWMNENFRKEVRRLMPCGICFRKSTRENGRPTHPTMAMDCSVGVTVNQSPTRIHNSVIQTQLPEEELMIVHNEKNFINCESEMKNGDEKVDQVVEYDPLNDESVQDSVEALSEQNALGRSNPETMRKNSTEM